MGIRDDNGHALIDNTTLTVTTPTEEQVKVTLPSGMSCDPLEIRGSTTTSTSVAITKTVDRHNNGKQFKITRSFEQSYKAGADGGGDLELGTNVLTCADKEQTSTVGCHAALANVDAVVFSSGSSQCDAQVDNVDADADIFYRTISGVTKAQSTGTAASTKLAYTTAVTATKTNCVFRVARHVITLDAMPTASAHGTPKHLITYHRSEAAVFRKLPRVAKKATNAPTVGLVMPSRAYAVATKVTLVNHVKPRRFWSNLQHPQHLCPII